MRADENPLEASDEGLGVGCPYRDTLERIQSGGPVRFRCCRAIIGAHERCQESQVEVAESIEGDGGAWILRITENVVSDWRRRRGTRDAENAGPNDDRLHDTAVSNWTPAHSLMAREEFARLLNAYWTAVEKLRSESRYVYNQMLGGRSYAALADELGKRKPALYMTVKRARDRIRVELRTKGFGDDALDLAERPPDSMSEGGGAA